MACVVARALVRSAIVLAGLWVVMPAERVEAQQAEGTVPVEDRYTRVGRLQACAAPLADRALLLVLFDEATDVGQVRVRVRRARPLMLRILSGTSQAPAAS